MKRPREGTDYSSNNDSSKRHREYGAPLGKGKYDPLLRKGKNELRKSKEEEKPKIYTRQERKQLKKDRKMRKKNAGTSLDF